MTTLDRSKFEVKDGKKVVATVDVEKSKVVLAPLSGVERGHTTKRRPSTTEGH